MLELEEARGRILAAVPVLPPEPVAASDALGRILAHPVEAPIALPSFDNSAMDGYAVRAADLKGASAANPVRLILTGQSPAGMVQSGAVEQGCCVRLFTGSALPPGSDAVVMQEDTQPTPGSAKEILFTADVKPWENVRFRGEDVKRGTGLFSPGESVSIAGISLLAALGVTEISVARRPVIGLLSSGSELLEAGQAPAPGKIYESNRALLKPLLEKAGAQPKVLPLVPDNLAATRAALEKAFLDCDGVVTTGGVSVGEHDLIKEAFSQVGGQLDFWKVAIRPGKPFVFGRHGQKFLFGLPGNPVSALVTFLLLVRPALRRWQGALQVDLPTLPGILAEALVNPGERRHFVRVSMDNAGYVRSAGIQGSHMLSSLARANGLLDMPPASKLEAGARVSVLTWE